MMAPQLRSTIAPVIAPAPADARYTAVSATSASRGSRPSNVSLTLVGASASVMPAVSGAKFDLIPTTLTPLRNVLHDAVADRVERYVDAAGRLGHLGDVGFKPRPDPSHRHVPFRRRRLPGRISSATLSS